MPEIKTPTLVLVGGFLGAGKTTLILCAAKVLARRGVRVGVIMNDQAGGLVDTQFAVAQDLAAEEVAGGCFCCRFSDLLAAANRLKADGAEVILAEPVGSCIDLSATIVKPMQAYHAGEYRLAPLTVLVDPAMNTFGNEDIEYLLRNQLAEADLVAVTKSDLGVEPAVATHSYFRLSARTGAGVEEWLDETLYRGRAAGEKILDVDYKRYADAEAALGWLNLDASIELRQPLSPASVAGPLLEDLSRALAGITVAHLKILDRSECGHVKVSQVGTGEDPVPDGDLMAEPSRAHELFVNLRAVADPAELDRIVRGAMAAIPGKVEIRQAGAFRPSPPQPGYRMESA